MRPQVVQWLLTQGLPGWIAPDYATMVGLAAMVSAILVVHVVRDDGEDVATQSRALLLAYAAALLGGFAFEWLRALPLAIALRSPAPVVFAGRAAYGGLLAALLVPAIYLRRRGQPVIAFFDRAIIPMGIAFALVRLGCFLEGCDYGQPTGLPWGIRFPPGSLAARDHTALGWIREGSASLPVHPTQLYESLLGAVALAAALPLLLERRPRDGRPFVAWMSIYAVGRFFLEFLRADADRGIYAGLSTAQHVSLAILAALGIAVVRRRRIGTRAVLAAVVAAVLLVVARPAIASPTRAPQAPAQPVSAQAASTPDALVITDGTRLTGRILETVPDDHVTLQLPTGERRVFLWALVARIELAGVVMTYGATPQPAATPTSPGVRAPVLAPAVPLQSAAPAEGAPAPALALPSAAPAETASSRDKGPAAALQRDRLLAVRAGLVPSIVLARPDVPSGLGFELDVLYRIRIGVSARFEIGLEGRRIANVEATEWSLGIPLELVLEFGRRFEITFEMAISNTWFLWLPNASSYFSDTNAYGLRLAGGAQLALGSHVLLGVSPLGFTTVASETVGVITAYEPRLWVGVAF